MKSRTNNFLSKTDILNAADQTFRRFGPDKTSVTDVAKLLGVSHGTLYRHYPSKAALREAVTERWLEEQIIVPLAELVEQAAGSPLQNLRAYVEKLIELKQRSEAQDPELFSMYAAVTGQATELIETHLQRIVIQLSRLVEQGRAAGVLATVEDSEVTARCIIHATSRFHHPGHAYEWKSPANRGEFLQLWSLLERGLVSP